jgi:SAM-dependent methyltransferase
MHLSLIYHLLNEFSVASFVRISVRIFANDQNRTSTQNIALVRWIEPSMVSQNTFKYHYNTMSFTSSSHKSDNGSRNLIIRRDKRGHLTTSNSLELKNPLNVIAAAIRYDESMNDESVLRIPLETGTIYNQKLFKKSLVYLQKVSASHESFASKRIRRREVEVNDSSGLAGSPGENQQFATSSVSMALPTQHEFIVLTPIIISGLLANLESICEHDTLLVSSMTSTSSEVTSTELVAYCNQMRRAAVTRVRLRKERQRVQRIATPILVCGGLIVLLFFTILNVQRIFVEFGFVDSCEYPATKDYVTACRMAEASTWEYLHQPFKFALGKNECTITSCPIVDTLVDDGSLPTYAMHTKLTSFLVPLDDVHGRRRRRTKRFPNQRGEIVGQPSTESSVLPIQWLGDTTVNRLVQNELRASQYAMGNANTFGLVKLLDIGSGLSGTLFSLMKSDFDLHDFFYHGISLSRPEIHKAKQLVEIHQLLSIDPSSSRPSIKNVTIEQGSFDDPLPAKEYNCIVAVESLAYSKNLTKTLMNLVKSLKPNGLLVVVDDVVAPWADMEDVHRIINLTEKRSLVTHEIWLSTFNSADFQLLRSPRELTLEFDMLSSISTPAITPVYDFADIMLQWWSFPRTNSPSASLVRLVHLIQDLIQHARGRSLRQSAFNRYDLGYYMYVLRKT